MDLGILRLVPTLSIVILSTVYADPCPSAEWKKDEESRMCYLFSEQRQTFTQAVDFCEKYETHLLQYEKGFSKQTIRNFLNMNISEMWIKAPDTSEGEINSDRNSSTETSQNVSTETISQIRYRLLSRREESCRVINMTNDKEVIESERCTRKLPFVCEESIKHLEKRRKGMRVKVVAAIIVGAIIGVLFLGVIVKTCHKRLKMIEGGEYSIVENKKKKEDEMILRKSEYIHIGSLRQPDTSGDTKV